jgi:hypothetical protein
MSSMEEAPQLRLLAQDAEDLQVISAAVQDAVVKVGDIHWEPSAHRLTLELNRYCWERQTVERVRTGLQLGCTLAVKARRIRRGAKEAVLELLALRFEPGEAPGGRVVFEFADGGDLSAEVECVDAVLADVSDAWPCRRAPSHDQGGRRA